MAKSDVNPAQITDLANRKSNLHKESNILGQTVEIHRSNIFYKPRNKWQIGKKSRIFNVTWVQNSAPRAVSIFLLQKRAIIITMKQWQHFNFSLLYMNMSLKQQLKAILKWFGHENEFYLPFIQECGFIIVGGAKPYLANHDGWKQRAADFSCQE